MKRIFLIMCIGEFFVIIGLCLVIAWWKKTHIMPGLSEMLNIKLVIAYLIVSVVLFIIFIFLFLIKRKH